MTEHPFGLSTEHMLVAAVLVGLVACLLGFYLSDRAYINDIERKVRKAQIHAQFKEPGSGIWMSTHGTTWYALSDSGSTYCRGNGYVSLHDALMNTRHSPGFLAEYDLDPEDIGIPDWDRQRSCWKGDGLFHVCNLVRNVDLLTFWLAHDPEALIFRGVSEQQVALN